MDYNITYRQKDKGWQYIISYKLNGKWKQKSKQGFKTKKEAKPNAEKMVEDLKRNIFANNISCDHKEDGVIFSILHDLYISHATLYKEHNTIKGYKNAYASFNKLKDKKVNKITKLDIQNCVDDMIKSGLSAETIKTYLTRISLFFDYYIDKYDSLYLNPTKNIKLPKDKKKTNKKALTKIELNLLLKQIEGTKFYIVAYIAANTGMRCGEILGLTWNDIDELNNAIYVNKQWKVLKDGTSGFGSLKTKNSNRIIPVKSSFISELKKYKNTVPISIDNRIAPFNKSSIEKYLNPLLTTKAGITLHEIRHTYATLLIGNGIDFKTVAKILGHEVEQTYRIYSHVTDEMITFARDVIEKIF